MRWTGNFTRHRVADSQRDDRREGSVAEYARMNNAGSAASSNLMDFGPLIFEE